jgi:hypothetical protein
VDIEPDEWQFIAGGPDIAAIDMTDRFADDDEVLGIGVDELATQDFIDWVGLGAGEDGFMLGLFVDHPGAARNLVAARFGNVSMLATADAPLEQPNGSVLPSHIFDMRSRPGFSGSPVFVYRTPSGDLRDVTHGRRRRTSPPPPIAYSRMSMGRVPFGSTEWQYELDVEHNLFITLLGIHAGQYPEKIRAKKVRRKAESSDDILRDRDSLEVPSSMTIVVPAWEFLKLLNVKNLREQRAERERQQAIRDGEKNRAAPESADEAELESDNPDHKEDFMRLLSAAGQKQPRDGQT